MPDNETPELIPRLRLSRNWENPADFATHQHSEIQNRRDLQALFAEITAYINTVMLPRAEQLLAQGGGGGGSGTGGGVSGDYLPLSGGTMRGILRLYRNPDLPSEAATKQYVDTLTNEIAADMDGNFTAINQRANGIELLAQNNAGDIANLTVEADRISTSVSAVDGRVSTLEQTADGFETRVTNAEGDISAIRQTVNGISLSVSTVTEHGEVYSKITLGIGEEELYGYIKLDGNVDISGQLSAETIYASYGEVANLAVDQLITSRRIVKYLQGDSSDDNFIRAYQQNMEWVTGKATGGTTQAKNPDGVPLYWPVNVSNLSRGADGYPVTAQNERIFTTTTRTNYPVQVYNYQDTVKRSISFEPVNGIYSPIDRFGVGNREGNNKGWILKTADGFDIRYLTPDAKEIGIHMGTDGKVTIDGLVYNAEDIREQLGGELTKINPDGSASGLSVDANGYTDISGLRKPVTLDFSNITSSGVFSETLDGGIQNIYHIQRDGSGRISKITDAAGHETVIVWGA